MAIVTINSRKLDGTIHRSWKGSLLEETSEYWLFIGEFEMEVKHSKLGVIRRGTISYEYYWKEKWFNVFRFHEPEGDLKYYYCNLNMPPSFDNEVLDYIDLDIDILVKKDSYQILDWDEFEANSKRFKYSDQLIGKVRQTLRDLLEIINKQHFPFDCKTH